MFERALKIRRYLKGMTLCQSLAVGMNWAIRRFCLMPLSTVHARAVLKAWGATVGSRLRVTGRLRVHVEGRLAIGSDVRINSGSANNYVGGDRRMSMWVGRYGVLTIKDGCGLSNSTIVCVNKITILHDTFIGGDCNIFDTDFHPLDAESRRLGTNNATSGQVTIGPAAFVAAGCTILKNVNIGEGAVIGAGSLVTRCVPSFEVWAGVPARFIKSLSSDTHAAEREPLRHPAR